MRADLAVRRPPLPGQGGYSPYLRYAFDGKETIHFVATEDHPRNFDNSLYHGFLRDGEIHYSDGKVLGPASKTVEANVATWDLTKVFAGDPDNVAWIDDVKLDRDGHPHLLFSVKKDGRGTHGKGGMDIRYHHGRWDGRAWQTREIAHAGTRLYQGEDDYTGLAVFDRNDLDVVYISTNADPATGQPLKSGADNRRHHELYRGTTADSGTDVAVGADHGELHDGQPAADRTRLARPADDPRLDARHVQVQPGRVDHGGRRDGACECEEACRQLSPRSVADPSIPAASGNLEKSFLGRILILWGTDGASELPCMIGLPAYRRALARTGERP